MLVQEGAVAGQTPSEADGAERRVFAVLGMRPEPGGYAVAKFSRSARPYEEWAAELMETHLSYPLLAFYRSQHVNQNWLAALTAMVDGPQRRCTPLGAVFPRISKTFSTLTT